MKWKLKHLLMLILLITGSQNIVAMDENNSDNDIELKEGDMIPGINPRQIECEEMGLPYIDENDHRTWKEIWDPILEQDDIYERQSRFIDSLLDDENYHSEDEEEYEDEEEDSDESLEDLFSKLSLTKKKKKKKPTPAYLQKMVDEAIATVDSWEPEIKLRTISSNCSKKVTEILNKREKSLNSIHPYTLKKLNKELKSTIKNRKFSQKDKILSIFNLVTRGANVNFQDVVSIAQNNNELLVWLTLLNLGAVYTSSKNDTYNIPELKKYKMAKVLISRKKVNSNTILNSILQACRKRALIPNMIIDDEYSLLHIAVQFNDINGAKTLLENGAFVDIRSAQKGLTPLHLAATLDNVDMVNLLLRHNANINLQTYNDKNTPLHLAISKNSREVFFKIFDRKDLNRKLLNSDNKTAKDLANCVNPGLFNLLKDLEQNIRISGQDPKSYYYRAYHQK